MRQVCISIIRVKIKVKVRADSKMRDASFVQVLRIEGECACFLGFWNKPRKGEVRELENQNLKKMAARKGADGLGFWDFILLCKYLLIFLGSNKILKIFNLIHVKHTSSITKHTQNQLLLQSNHLSKTSATNKQQTHNNLFNFSF